MKNNSISIFLPLILILTSFRITNSDPFIKINDIDDAGLDLMDNLYVTLSNGRLIKYDQYGEQLNSFSRERKSRISQLDISGNFRIFLFYQLEQRYLFLDRNFNILTDASFDLNDSGPVDFSTFADDQSIWTYQEIDFKLRKVDPQRSNFLIDRKINLLLSTSDMKITDMEAHQNRLYINNGGKEILVFDSFGNYQKKMPVSTEKKISFYKNDMIFISDEKVYSIDIYRNQIYSLISSVDNIENLQKALVGENYLYLIYKNAILRILK